MEEEILAGMILGMMFALPFGYFLRSAVQWRREARRVAPPVTQPVAISATEAPAEARVVKALERLNHRLESVEERMEFTESILDSRSMSSPSRRDPVQR